jgi:hypothetical protein
MGIADRDGKGAFSTRITAYVGNALVAYKEKSKRSAECL